MKKILILIFVLFCINIVNAQQSDKLTTIILLRHAEKVDDGTRNPDLSITGHERALLVKSKFENTSIDAIYSSPYKRTRQTVMPLAKKASLDVIEYNPSSKNFIKAIYEANIGKTVLVSGHSNTTPTAVNDLVGENRYENIDHEEYGKIFIVTIDSNANTSVLEIHY